MRALRADVSEAGTGADEDALVRALARGEDGAMAALAALHLDSVLGLAWRNLGNRADAEDVAQETFMRLLSKAAIWQPGEPGLRAWLFRVATNLCIDRHRARARAPRGAEDAENIADTSGAPLEGSIAITRAVRGALAALPARQRAALVLVHYHGMTGREAGKALGVGEEAVESLLARGRRHMRKALAADAHDLLETRP